MKLLLTLIGLVMIIEGLPYFAFPEKMQEVMRSIEKMHPEILRKGGFFAIITGLLLCYLAQRSGLFNG